ncbi:uncharacterized protein B0H18DRAFT_505652 [Fomitopsis serialis]|uniref:uncharacterized protein n=1 Tax=Fomitopsis serialis TaxID=139415 RepID=UPI00200780E5|nr:uncharacterized protein B0H18DRAFT_505652 [Neoantrodia serialis]KAH9922591.1 hypothetical protein B0H18DRAFT_505652 [Neoantrodia serialis]
MPHEDTALTRYLFRCQTQWFLSIHPFRQHINSSVLAMASSLLQLDLDTTTVILTLIEPVDALRLALTCRAAQKVAIPRLLSEVDIGPDWQKNGRDRVGKFSRYMLQRPAERIPHLKTLVLNSETFVTGAADPRTGEMYVDFNFTAAVSLAAVVQRALRLRKLSIGGAEFLFEGVPELAAAVASLTNIQELSFTHTGIGVARVLSRMRSRPRDVECSILEMRDKQEAKRYTNFRLGRDRFLHNFTECLEKVRLDGILLDLSQDILSLLEGDTVWPRVHDLTINDSVVDNLNFFARAFPNVRRLHLNAVSVNEPVINSAAWTSLDFLALHWPRCPVCHRIRWLRFNFTLTSGRHYRNAMRYAESEDLLRATKPAILDAFGTPELFKCVAEANLALKFLRVYVAPTATGSPSGQVDSLDSWLVSQSRCVD